MRYIFIYFCKMLNHSIPMGQERKSKRVEDEILTVAPHSSERWLVYHFTSRFTPENDSYHKGWFPNGPFPWKPGSRKGFRKEAS